VVAEDESIFTYEITIKKVWTKKGNKLRQKVTGSKKKTCVFGGLTHDGQQLFRQYDTCNSVNFIDYLKELKRKVGKMVLFIDRAPWHTSKITTKFLKQNKDVIKIKWFPKGFPESNPVEECWQQGKYDDELGAKFHVTYAIFQKAVSTYYRTKRFKLNLYNYLCQ